MKIAYSYLLLILIGSALISCNQNQSRQPDFDRSLYSYTTDYQAPAFINDDRVAQIKMVGPKIEELIKEHAKAMNIPGIAFGLVVDHELVLASATGVINLENSVPATSESAFRIASMTKSFTAMAILKLRDEGKLSLNDPVSKYLQEMDGMKYLTKDAPVVDIENLLTMTAGFPEDNPWADRQLDETDQMLNQLMSDGLSFSNLPSYEYEYSNTGFALLGRIITRVSGQPYQEYISENILMPLGMTHTFWEFDRVPEAHLVAGYRWEDEQWKVEPMLHDGAFGSIGGLITTIEDFSKYVSFHLAAWPPRSDEDSGPVKRSTLREMHTPQFIRLNSRGTNYNGEPCPSISGYGFGLGITSNCDGLRWVSHGGALPGFGSSYVFYPDYGIGIMAFCNLTYTTPWPLKEIGQALFETIDLKPRMLPASSVLVKRQDQVARLIQNWDSDLEKEILAENFYLDTSREHRKAEIQNILDRAGAIQSMDTIVPFNQLRGRFRLNSENGTITIFFTLTPEKDPKVQELTVSFQSN